MKPSQWLLDARSTFAVRETWVDGCRILARRSVVTPARSTPTVVALGGTALSGRYLLPVGVALARRYPVWVPDLPGRGASESPKPALTVEEHADHLVAWLDEVGCDHVALLGNSMGCQIAVETAVRHPARVSHLVLQGPATDAGARGLLRQFVRLLRCGPHEPLSLGPLEALDWARAGPRYVWQSVRSTLEHPIELRLPLVSCPALVVRGTRDAVAPLDWVARVRDLLPDGRLRQIPGAAHAVGYSHPLELARLTDAFLRGLS